MARTLQESFTVFSLDLPGHGRSPWQRGLTLSNMADTVLRWMDVEGVSQPHLLGHSVGGKVAMQLALQAPDRAESLIVCDIAPVGYPARHDQVFSALEAVAARECSSRDEAATILAQYLHDEGVIQFLLASLQRDTQGRYRWRFDVEGLKAAYPALLDAPTLDRAYEGPVLFIKGGASDYIRREDWPAVRRFFPQARIKILPGCGHWLHAQSPQAFNNIVMRFLAPLEQRKLDATQAGGE